MLVLMQCRHLKGVSQNEEHGNGSKAKMALIKLLPPHTACSSSTPVTMNGCFTPSPIELDWVLGRASQVVTSFMLHSAYKPLFCLQKNMARVVLSVPFDLYALFCKSFSWEKLNCFPSNKREHADHQ